MSNDVAAFGAHDDHAVIDNVIDNVISWLGYFFDSTRHLPDFLPDMFDFQPVPVVGPVTFDVDVSGRQVLAGRVQKPLGGWMFIFGVQILDPGSGYKIGEAGCAFSGLFGRHRYLRCKRIGNLIAIFSDMSLFRLQGQAAASDLRLQAY